MTDEVVWTVHTPTEDVACTTKLELRALVYKGHLSPSTYVYCHQTKQWKYARDFPETEVVTRDAYALHVRSNISEILFLAGQGALLLAVVVFALQTFLYLRDGSWSGLTLQNLVTRTAPESMTDLVHVPELSSLRSTQAYASAEVQPELRGFVYRQAGAQPWELWLLAPNRWLGAQEIASKVLGLPFTVVMLFAGLGLLYLGDSIKPRWWEGFVEA